MKVYKVRFDNNTAVAAEFEGYRYSSNLEMERQNGRKMIRSLNVVADTPEESILIANNMVKAYFNFLSIPS